MGLLDPPALSIAQANLRYGSVPNLRAKISPLVGALGDSLSVNGDAATVRFNSPLHAATLKSLGKIQYAFMGGVSGQSSTQILARVGDAVASPAGTIVVLMGANDSAGTGPFDTVTRPNLDATVAALLAGGKTPVLATLPPRGTSASPATTTQKQFIAKYNLYVRRLAAKLGTPLVDYYTALVDTTGDYYHASVAGDGIHPNAAGWSTMGTVLSNALIPYLPTVNPPLPQVNNDAASLTDNCLFLNVTGLLPTGWVVSSGTSGTDGYTISTVAATVGNKIRLDLASTTAQKAVWRQNIPVVAGNKLLIVGLMAWSGVLVTLQIDRTTSGTTSFGVFKPTTDVAFSQTSPVPVFWEYTPPAGTTTVNVELVVKAGTGYAELSQFALYDLTAQQQL